MQYLEVAGANAPVNPLMTWVEAAGMARHRDHAGFLLRPDQPLRIGHGIRHRDFNHHVLAGAHALDTLGGMHLGWRGQDHRLQAGLRQALAEIGGPMRDLPLLRHLARGLQI
jgi:hypothetical protein